MGPMYHKAQRILGLHDLGVILKQKPGCDQWYFPSSTHVLRRFEAMDKRPETKLPDATKKAIIKDLIDRKVRLLANPGNYKVGVVVVLVALVVALSMCG